MGGHEKEWMGYFLDDLRAFGINVDQWTTAAHDEGEWRRTAKQEVEHFMAESIDRCRKIQGWTTACSRMPERDGKDQEKDTQRIPKGYPKDTQRKRARAGSLAF